MADDKITIIPGRRTDQECALCDGTGKHSWGDPDKALEPCFMCHGTGYLDLSTWLSIQEWLGNDRNAKLN